MQTLPSEIKSIVYRYIYDNVLRQLLSSYGKTLRLNRVPYSELCERVSDDITEIPNFVFSVNLWRFRISVMNNASHASYRCWNPLWNDCGLCDEFDCNAS
jgi:hypothetical protein